MPICAPRTRSSAAAGSPMSSLPASSALPVARPFAARSPITARNSWLLPAPDSPTTPRHSARLTESVTSCTAATGPCGVSKLTLSSRTLSSASGSGRELSVLAGIEGIAQAITEQVETQQQQHQRDRRHEQHPRRGLHLLCAGVDEVAEARLRLLHPESEEGKEALEQNHLRHDQRAVHRHRTQHVRHDVTPEDARGRYSRGARRLDKLAAFQCKSLRAHDACRRKPADRSEREGKNCKPA